LRQLWNEVKDVPTTIEDLLDELELTAMTMAILEDQATTSNLASSPEYASVSNIQRQATEWCHKVHKGLENIVLDLGSDIASTKMTKRVKGTARVALKREALEGYQKRLDRTRQFLNITYAPLSTVSAAPPDPESRNAPD
jgi:hypothetical protein